MQQRRDQERERAELLIAVARIAAGQDVAQVLDALVDDSNEPDYEEGGGEEVFDVSGAEWVGPSGEEELAMLLAMQQVSVPNASMTPTPGAPLDDGGEDRQWL